MKNQGKKNPLSWTSTFINASRKRLYYSCILNSKQMFHWIPLHLPRNKLISSFLHGNSNKMSLFYTTIFINHIFLIFWRAQFGWNWPMWSKSTGWRQKRCLTHSDIHKARTKINLIVSSLKYTFWVLAFHHDSFKPIQWKSE